MGRLSAIIILLAASIISAIWAACIERGGSPRYRSGWSTPIRDSLADRLNSPRYTEIRLSSAASSWTSSERLSSAFSSTSRAVGLAIPNSSPGYPHSRPPILSTISPHCTQKGWIVRAGMVNRGWSLVDDSLAGSRRKELETFRSGQCPNAEGPTFRPTLPVKVRTSERAEPLS
jgi:hypothetical protein